MVATGTWLTSQPNCLMFAFGGKSDIAILLFADCKSVFGKFQSLFAVKISLLLILGKLPRNDDEPRGICSGNGLNLPEFAKFPVKFPVSREWRSETGPICTWLSQPVQSLGFSRQSAPERPQLRGFARVVKSLRF